VITQQGTEKFAKKLLGESEIEAILQRLDRLTQEEGRMTMAQTLEVVYGLMNNVKVVMNGTQKFAQLVTVDQLSCLGRWKGIDGWYLEGLMYAFTAFRLGLAKADDDVRYNATNGERNKQDQAFVITSFCD